ncbi:trigger factor [Brumimicrobium salinarum]|uniref:Trigger factor n=1 Tax=Brumimicrobium salinarum TaxID=2058658 RepID=A0A2I0R2R4_9FLAO|nr:trigger factor [Brumimicrobium salinarum]PKR80857.1 trigger factor [Brumimicrobium salinarum]
MNITKENVDELNAILKVTVEKEDYQEKVDSTLKDYRKKANIPGFRKGKVPMGIVKKQYGQNILGEELNRIVSEGLFKYVDEQDFEVLGNPLPKNDVEVKGDFNNPDTFEFTYEIGIAPKVDVKLSGRNKYEYTKVKIDKKLVDKQLEDLTRRYGKLSSGEKVGERDMVMGKFVELNDKGEILEGGVMNDSTISMEFVEDEKLKKEMIGKKPGDKITLDPRSVSRGESDTASMLGIEESELENVSNKFQLTINEVKVMEPAELNQELFDKLFGEGEVKSEKEMRAKIEKDLAEMFEKDSDKILTRRISNDLIKKTDLSLPDEFLKKWILASQKEPITKEEVEKDYENYARSLRWQLIQNKIFKDAEMKVEQEEALNYTKGLLVNQYAQYGMPAPDDAELTQSAQQVLGNQKEAQQIYDMLAEEKLTKYFKETVKLNEKEVDYDEYVKIAQDSNA